jgi:hypothetical protein
MKIVNRGFIAIKPKKSFWDWARTKDESITFTEEDHIEANIYLITEDFFDDGPILEQHFKKIFINELDGVCDEVEGWPEERTLNVFKEWFEIELGGTVFDLEKSDLRSDL